MSDEARDAGYDDFLDAIEAGEPYYLENPNGNGWLPPRTFDPETGEEDLTETPLPEPGEILTYSETYVATPDFADDAPFVVAIAEFGPVRITGQLPDTSGEDVDIGTEVDIAVGESVTTGERVVQFELH